MYQDNKDNKDSKCIKTKGTQKYVMLLPTLEEILPTEKCLMRTQI